MSLPVPYTSYYQFCLLRHLSPLSGSVRLSLRAEEVAPDAQAFRVKGRGCRLACLAGSLVACNQSRTGVMLWSVLPLLGDLPSRHPLHSEQQHFLQTGLVQGGGDRCSHAGVLAGP